MKLPRFSGLLAAVALLASAMPTLAQTGSIVYWRNVTTEPSPSIHHRYQIGGSGISELFNVFPTKTGSPSNLGNYPGGRAFFADAPMDPIFDIIPGTNRVMRVPLLMPEQATNYAPVLAVFFGPEEFIDSADVLVSNNDGDNFISFQAFNTVLNARRLYRYDGPISDFYTPTFNPNSFSFNPFFGEFFIFGPDPRLTTVTFYGVDTFATSWDFFGLFVLLQTPGPSGLVTSMHDTQFNSTGVLNDPAVSGFRLINPVFGRDGNIYAVAEMTDGSIRGLASFDGATLTWILRETGDAGLSQFKGPVVSPDGQSLAFTLLRPGKVGTINGTIASLATVPIAGGAFTPLWNMGLVAESGPLRVNNFEPTGWKTGTLPAAPPPPPIIPLPPVGPDGSGSGGTGGTGGSTSPDALRSP
jgi:hypothetical protein